MARYTGGWFKSYREAWDKDLSQNIYLWGIWNALLHMASYKESQILWEGKQRTLPPGSVVFGITELADKWHCSKSVVKKWLHYLQNCNRIVIESCPRGTLVTICNWTIYQVSELEACLQRDDNESTTSLQRVHNEPLMKKVRKKERKKKEENMGIHLDYPKEFDQLWEAYGRRGDKKEAFQQFEALALNSEDLTRLGVAVSNYALENPDLKYRKHFVRFLKSDWRESLRLENGHAPSWNWADEQGNIIEQGK